MFSGPGNVTQIGQTEECATTTAGCVFLRPMRYLRRYFFLVPLAILLVASCKPDTQESEMSSEPVPPVAKPDSPVRAVVPTELLVINALRTRGCNCGDTYMPPVAPLKWNAGLEQAARVHATNMKAKGFFGHQSPEGTNVAVRATNAGYTWRTIAENIAFGQPNLEEVMRSWQDSPGHCRNLMNGQVTEIGMARADLYWVQVFGQPR